jgi:hypothetical protein
MNNKILIDKLCRIWFTRPTLDEKTVTDLEAVIKDLASSIGANPEDYNH